MFRRSIVTALAVIALSPPAVSAQLSLAHALDGMPFREIGPAIMGGRVADVAPLESNPAKFYLGLATGGVWLTENNGMSWTSLFDDQPCSSIGDVTVNQANPNVVWVGTGEPQNRQSSPWGCGVFKSMDGGRTWADMGLNDTRHIGRIMVHPSDPDIAYVAAVGHLFGPNEERGVYKTSDGGATWDRILYIDEHTGAIDLVMDPSDPHTLFAAMYQRERKSFGFSAGGGGSGLYRTHDGGESWTELTKGLPEGDKGRIGLDVYRRDGNLLYALVESDPRGTGLYKSTDRGDSWEQVSDRNPRPMYFSQVRIDPSNPERIYLGGVSFSASDDGGKTWWEGDAAEGVHVDSHALWIDPNNSNYVILGTDGGIHTSWDGAKTWRHHNNLAIGQFYEIGVDNSDPYRVCGGLQDNSSWCAPNQTTTPYGLKNRDWVDVWGGDGFYNKIDPNNPDIVYTESQGGNSGRVNLATGETLTMRPSPRPEGDEDVSYRYNWNAPIAVSEHNSNTVYVANNHVMRSRDQGLTWEEASPDLTRQIDRDSLTIMGELVTSTTLSRHDGQSEFGTISVVEESPMSADVLYAGTDDGNLQVTQDGGSTWTNVVGNIRDLPAMSYVSRIDASHHVAGRVYASFDRHWQDDYRPFVYVSEDFGASWQKITNGLPDWSVNAVREHPHSEGLLFVGNEIGVFASINRGESWSRMTGMPTVPVDDIVVHPRDNDLVLGTHGRSIWILDDLSPLEHMSRGMVADQPAYVFPVETATQVFRLGGWPFWGDLYEADNPPDGAIVRYWLAAETEDVTVKVLSPTGQTVRELEASGDAGLNQVIWDMREEAPVNVPPQAGGGGRGGGGGGGRGGGAPNGPLVLPGTYLVQLEAADQVVQQEVTIRLDPRAETNMTALRARQEAARSAASISGTITLATRALQRLTGQIDDAKALLKDVDGSDELKAEAEALSAAIDSVRSDLQNANPGRAASGVESNGGAPSGDVVWALDRAWGLLPSLVERVNELITADVPAFNRKLDDAGVRPDPGEPVVMPPRRGGLRR